MFGISGTELFFIVVFALIIFGPDKLPQFARTVGRFMKEFERVRKEAEGLIKAELSAVDEAEPGTAGAGKVAETAEGLDVPEQAAALTMTDASPVFGDDVDDEEEEEE